VTSLDTAPPAGVTAVEGGAEEEVEVPEAAFEEDAEDPGREIVEVEDVGVVEGTKAEVGGATSVGVVEDEATGVSEDEAMLAALEARPES